MKIKVFSIAATCILNFNERRQIHHSEDTPSCTQRYRCNCLHLLVEKKCLPVFSFSYQAAKYHKEL